MAQRVRNPTSNHKDVGLISDLVQWVKESGDGVPIVAQWLTNLTRNHKVAGSIPALAQ